MTVIAVETFRAAPGCAREELEALDARFQQEVAYQAPGLLRRTTAVGNDGSWLVVTVWADEESAEAFPGLGDSEQGRALEAMTVEWSGSRYHSLD